MAEKTENRLTRELETRELQERPKQWMPPRAFARARQTGWFRLSGGFVYLH